MLRKDKGLVEHKQSADERQTRHHMLNILKSQEFTQAVLKNQESIFNKKLQKHLFENKFLARKNSELTSDRNRLYVERDGVLDELDTTKKEYTGLTKKFDSVLFNLRQLKAEFTRQLREAAKLDAEKQKLQAQLTKATDSREEIFDIAKEQRKLLADLSHSVEQQKRFISFLENEIEKLEGKLNKEKESKQTLADAKPLASALPKPRINIEEFIATKREETRNIHPEISIQLTDQQYRDLHESEADTESSVVSLGLVNYSSDSDADTLSQSEDMDDSTPVSKSSEPTSPSAFALPPKAAADFAMRLFGPKTPRNEPTATPNLGLPKLERPKTPR